MKSIKLVLSIAVILSSSLSLWTQFRGNTQIDAQTYKSDEAMGAERIKEQMQSNGFFNLLYNSGGVSAGVRYEYYLNPLLGIDNNYKGQGIAHRYIVYRSDWLEVTAGNFYEQFGSGLIFRAHEEKSLGLDNAIDGVRFKLRPISGLDIVGIWGTQRDYWSQGEGIVRGADISFSWEDFFDERLLDAVNFVCGVSGISVFQSDSDPQLIMPENVFAWSGRAALFGDSWTVDGEYSYKINNPTLINRHTYNSGYGLLLNASYFVRGFSASVNLHKIDNMDFRSDRYATKSELMLNYIPPISKQHTYRLASMYPYATQLNGEVGIQLDLQWQLQRNSTLGGVYGTDIGLNLSQINSIDTTKIDDFTYDSPFFGVGKEVYFRDINLNIARRLTKDLKTTLSYFNITYDRDRIENSGVPNSGKVYSNIVVAEGLYNISRKYSLKLELSHQWTEQDSAVTSHDIINGNWLGIMGELTISPGWYISLWDDWNYGNENTDKQIHYLNGSIAYSKGSNRVALGYGRQRSGILCVGGVCRVVPASNGFNISVSIGF